MIEAEFIAFISNVGFPIAICTWFILRTEKVINNNTSAMNNFTNMTKKCQIEKK